MPHQLDVDLVPCKSMPCRGWVCMMIVVSAFAKVSSATNQLFLEQSPIETAACPTCASPS